MVETTYSQARAKETLYLLRSPRNAARLLAALKRARSGKVKPRVLDELRRDLEMQK